MARGNFPSSEQDQYPIRFPDGMRDRIKEEAAKNGRSMNAEIVHRLEASFSIPMTLESDIARLIEAHVTAKVSERLREIASRIGGEA